MHQFNARINNSVIKIVFSCISSHIFFFCTNLLMYSILWEIFLSSHITSNNNLGTWTSFKYFEIAHNLIISIIILFSIFFHLCSNVVSKSCATQDFLLFYMTIYMYPKQSFFYQQFLTHFEKITAVRFLRDTLLNGMHSKHCFVCRTCIIFNEHHVLFHC
jgi:hypothetical protein